ncbi:hypothetical protein BKA70DRAFT_1229709 [Coprinopsis sp. MPI-PUGE-AT-0042]|nr:hypothetical protein BKA70DRAFT_1229709 [Coprinopsis sp. MPI-PUGE-AT-0042]
MFGEATIAVALKGASETIKVIRTVELRTITNACKSLDFSRDAIVRSCLGRILASHTTSKRRRTFGRPVLHFDFRSESLTIWFWTVVRQHRLKLYGKTPALENARESRIGLAGTESSRTGAYIAECAQNRCGYYVYLEDFYPVLGLRIRRYALRDLSIPEGSTLPAVATTRRWAMAIGRGGVSERDFWIAIAQCPNCQWLLPKLELQAHVCKPGFVRRIEVIDLTEED